MLDEYHIVHGDLIYPLERYTRYANSLLEVFQKFKEQFQRGDLLTLLNGITTAGDGVTQFSVHFQGNHMECLYQSKIIDSEVCGLISCYHINPVSKDETLIVSTTFDRTGATSNFKIDGGYKLHISNDTGASDLALFCMYMLLSHEQ